MTNDDVLTLVRSADPLDPAEVDRWIESGAPDRIADQIQQGSRRRPAHRRRRVMGVVIVGVVVASTGAAAASGLLGRSAPDRVKAHLADLDRGLPADLRANPLLEAARSVAESPTATLYAADTADGGYCIEVVTAIDTPRGAACIAGDRVAARPIEVNSPLVHGSEPVILAGRVVVPGLGSLLLVGADGAVEPVVTSSDGYWIAELTGAPRQRALAAGVTLRAMAASGAVLAEITVPPLAEGAPADLVSAPIEVTTVSNGDDLTLVLGVDGIVHRPDATSVELTYPDRTVVSIPVGPDGTFHYTLPLDRRHDLSDAPAQLVARDRGGAVIGTTSVSSVAYWHRQHG